ncbi:hypothetical protein SORBI_3007G114401 [Sorghum bicolor]|uniref:Uncharacterized protein n=1 Tax=Sorghum bicolor TaxID=4558 RepID=A0A1Z5RAD8_SORBI|nr:hypothetical protein SORBI_3007G114401 [Sorghum bicolor]
MYHCSEEACMNLTFLLAQHDLSMTWPWTGCFMGKQKSKMIISEFFTSWAFAPSI